ncbi:hypothetical protein MUA04_01215 [Enterobacteriaceae bacterium H11S18]|uniref:hypothetical protein n=1 Tax=Dryocola clanedunensis TaxID=2925396 RepID=UPI0022F01DA5|nr:hypothetical protein [Dryocola clanedunensis]MCT4708853.1 hypothetical protein [Dryocola clanedunensis]
MRTKIAALAFMMTSSLAVNICQAETTTAQVKLPDGVKSEILNTLKISDIHLPEGNKPLTCRELRFRTVDVKPGSHIDLHSHENRPAMLGVTRGTSIVHPYQHQPVTLNVGDSYKEYANVHYARNGSETDMLTMTTFDLLDDGSPCNSVTYPQNTPLLDKLKAEHDKFYVDAPKKGGLEKSNPVYSHNVSDIQFSDKSDKLTDRVMRVRKVTLSAGTALPKQDFSNRPTYLLVLDGALDVEKSGNTDVSPVGKLGTADLVNAGNVTIKNDSATAAAGYLVFEIWDPKDTDAI